MCETSGTLCWDCANSTGGCSWSDDLTPVNGWTTEDSIKDGFPTYKVIECPEFNRDALEGGLKRLPYNR